MSKPYSAEQLKWFADNNYSITTRSVEDKSKVVSVEEMISRFLATITAQAKVIEKCSNAINSYCSLARTHSHLVPKQAFDAQTAIAKLLEAE